MQGPVFAAGLSWCSSPNTYVCCSEDRHNDCHRFRKPLLRVRHKPSSVGVDHASLNNVAKARLVLLTYRPQQRHQQQRSSTDFNLDNNKHAKYFGDAAGTYSYRYCMIQLRVAAKRATCGQRKQMSVLMSDYATNKQTKGGT